MLNKKYSLIICFALSINLCQAQEDILKKFSVQLDDICSYITNNLNKLGNNSLSNSKRIITKEDIIYNFQTKNSLVQVSRTNGDIINYGIEDYCDRFMDYKKLYGYDKIKVTWKLDPNDKPKIKYDNDKFYTITVSINQQFVAYYETTNIGLENKTFKTTMIAYSDNTKKSVQFKVRYDNGSFEQIKLVAIKVI